MAQSAISKFQDLLKKKKLKFTQERRILLEEALKEGQHFDADDWYAELRMRGLKIARDTVFRSIPLLLEAGILQKSVGQGRGEYFESPGARGHHDHIVCLSCGEFLEFSCEKIEALQREIAVANDFELTFHDHRLFGYCKTCRSEPLEIVTGSRTKQEKH